MRDQAASKLQELTGQLVVDADAISKQPGNAAPPNQIKAIAAEIKGSGDAMVAAAKAGQSTSAPHGQLIGKIQQLHTACNLPAFKGPSAVSNAPAPPAHVATGACDLRGVCGACAVCVVCVCAVLLRK